MGLDSYLFVGRKREEGGKHIPVLSHLLILSIIKLMRVSQDPKALCARHFPCRQEDFCEEYFHFHSTQQMLFLTLAPSSKRCSPPVTVSRLSGLHQAKRISFYTTVQNFPSLQSSGQIMTLSWSDNKFNNIGWPAKTCEFPLPKLLPNQSDLIS